MGTAQGGSQPASLGSCIHFVRMTATYLLPLLPVAPKVTLATQADQIKQENNRRDGQAKTEASAHCVAQKPRPGRDGSTNTLSLTLAWASAQSALLIDIQLAFSLPSCRPDKA